MLLLRLFSIVVLGVVLIAFSQQSRADAFFQSCSGAPIDFKDAKAACASGAYPGQQVVTCRDDGSLKKTRLCNSDGARKGVYLNDCSGLATGFKSIAKACGSGSLDGQLLVQCNRGEEGKRRMCELASGDGPRTAVFAQSCGNGAPLEQRSLKSACRVNGGATLVLCNRKGAAWVAEKSMACEGPRDRLTIKNCSDTERDTLIEDYRWAETRVDEVRAEAEALFRTNFTASATSRRRMQQVRSNLEKLSTHMDRKRTFFCRANRNDCGRPVNAHVTTFALRDSPREVRFCGNYFANPTRAERGSIMVHEISHYLLETNDNGREHGGCSSPRLAGATTRYQNHAEYYEHIIECGLYVP